MLPSYQCAKHLLLLGNPQGNQSGHSCAPQEKKGRENRSSRPAGARKGENTHPAARPSSQLRPGEPREQARPARSHSHTHSHTELGNNQAGCSGDLSGDSNTRGCFQENSAPL
ncbi:NHL-repeat-containing protein 4 [Platysternon megacephalum]|uniref:NHL-repeat-containing protein 4 n=1 Tax=Platysternon megacephalum TaxID=55544 RepID=A0A4D9E2T0_9SAUR|nr:NHL-repeat-containing protein 4 [Platysternon megacephalum]